MVFIGSTFGQSSLLLRCSVVVFCMYFMRTLMRIGIAIGLSCKVVITKVIKVSMFASPFQSIKCISKFSIARKCCS
jgi:hypothetical protein